LAQGEGTRVLSGETESGYACLMFTDDALTGAALVGGTKAGMKLKKAIVEKRKFTNSNINEILSSL
jgi:NAD(P)H-nitrite reductase large subunit